MNNENVYKDVANELVKFQFETSESSNNEESLKSYPFEFLLRISYQLSGTSIKLSYEVENLGLETLLFSIGAHPAFNLPLVEGTVYEDYFLEFDKPEDSVRHTLKGNIVSGTTPFFDHDTRLPLKASLFKDDALIFKDLKSTRISIKSNKTSHGLHYDFAGFPYMGIWAAPNAPFVCIEPWCGIADVEGHNQNIEDKEGIIGLPDGQKWTKGWSLECF